MAKKTKHLKEPKYSIRNFKTQKVCQNQKCVKIKCVSKSKVSQNQKCPKNQKFPKIKSVPKSKVSQNQMCPKI